MKRTDSGAVVFNGIQRVGRGFVVWHNCRRMAVFFNVIRARAYYCWLEQERY